MKRILPLILCAAMLLTLPVFAADAAAAEPEATDLTAQCTILCNGGGISNDMRDNSYFTRGTVAAGSVIKVSCATPIGGIYARFDQTGRDEYPAAWTLEVNGEERSCGENGWQQQYVGGFSATELTMTFHEETGISDLYFISEGARPDWVHDWAEQPEKVDVLLMACHSDDDQYTFCGLIPWVLSKGASIQVAYFINHYTHPNRVHEQLDGLWASGIHHYPEMGHYRDEERDSTLQNYIDTGFTEEELIGSCVEVYRRYKPQVVVTHAVNGEYGHGGHIIYTQLCIDAIEHSNNPESYPESAEKYGVWELPKVYVHLQQEKEVVLDFDTPLDMFDGRTAYKVGQDAFMYEVSQTWYPGQMSWLYGQDLASEVTENPVNRYGLFYSTVGDDVNSDTIFDNLDFWPIREQREAEEAARQAAEEAERAAAEAEEARLAQEEAERAAAEKAAQAELERITRQQAEEAARQAALEQRLEEHNAALKGDKLLQTAAIALPLLLIGIVVLLVLAMSRSKQKKRKTVAKRRCEVYEDEYEDDYEDESPAYQPDENYGLEEFYRENDKK